MSNKCPNTSVYAIAKKKDTPLIDKMCLNNLVI